MSSENPTWQREAQRLIPKWGTTTSVTLSEVDNTAFLDTSGRPLNERNKMNLADVPFEYVFGLADGGRDTYPVNISAYSEVASVFPDALGLISYLRHMILPYGKKPTAGGIESVLNAVNALPIWMVFRADNPIPNGEIPTYLAGASKIARGGLIPYYLDMVKDVISIPRSIDPPVPVTAQDLIARVFGEEALLIGDKNLGETPTQTACPAPRKKIEQFAHVLFVEPTVNKDEIGARLGLSPAEIQRVRQFGRDLIRGITITSLYNNLPSIFSSQQQYLNIMNGVQRRFNNALGRDGPPELTSYDLFPQTRGGAFDIK